MHFEAAVVLRRARSERLNQGFISDDTRAELKMFGISAIQLEAYLIQSEADYGN
jgi:hypothetical protein